MFGDDLDFPEQELATQQEKFGQWKKKQFFMFV